MIPVLPHDDEESYNEIMRMEMDDFDCTGIEVFNHGKYM